jgi:hypothetical protein
MEDKDNNEDMSRVNWFMSKFFYEKIQPQNNKENKNENGKIIEDLEDILKCYMCLEYLDNPVCDPLSCSHYACKKCLLSYFNKMKTDVVPCPLCRRRIRKSNLRSIPLVENIKEIMKEVKNLHIYEEEKIDEKCSTHPKNKVFYICLDCAKKMCPICDAEKKKHETHHMVNYERYVQLFNCFHNNFSEIKDKIKKIENNIKKYNSAYVLLEQQKKSYLDLLKNIYNKIETIFSKNKTKLQKIISESINNIAFLEKFMNDLKKDVSSRFQTSYDDIENFEEIEKEIKEKVNSIKIKYSKIEVPNMENIISKKLVSSKEEFSLTINKKNIYNTQKIFRKRLDSQEIYKFGAELSDDNKFILCYLDVENEINNKKNESAYSSCIEFGTDQKKIYLEEEKFDDKHYSYQKIIPIEEFFPEKQDKIDIKIKVNYISII